MVSAPFFFLVLYLDCFYTLRRFRRSCPLGKECVTLASALWHAVCLGLSCASTLACFPKIVSEIRAKAFPVRFWVNMWQQ